MIVRLSIPLQMNHFTQIDGSNVAGEARNHICAKRMEVNVKKRNQPQELKEDLSAQKRTTVYLPRVII
jgi:hypothetical protein